MKALDWACPPAAAFADGHSPALTRRADGSSGAAALIEEAPITLVFNDEASSFGVRSSKLRGRSAWLRGQVFQVARPI